LFLKAARQALVFAGSMTFNPATDTLTDKNGKPFKFKAPYGNPSPPRRASLSQFFWNRIAAMLVSNR